MSINSEISIQLDVLEAGWQLALLATLTQHGWAMDDHGRVVVLPLGDKGDFSWGAFSGHQREVFALFRSKIAQGEPLGVMLSWKDTQVGGPVIIRDDGTVSFCASVNRRRVDGDEITDVSWYLQRLLPAIEQACIGTVSSWQWTESR